MCVCDHQKQEEQKPGAEPADMEGEALIAMVTKAVTAIIGRLQSESPLCVCMSVCVWCMCVSVWVCVVYACVCVCLCVCVCHCVCVVYVCVCISVCVVRFCA